MYYQLAQQEFESYLNGYDRENDRIKLKIIHTYGVVKQAEELAGRMHLSAEDTDLARLIALLHDIGRFEQLKRYDSFEPGTMDHAAYGVKAVSNNHLQPHRTKPNFEARLRLEKKKIKKQQDEIKGELLSNNEQ